MFDPVLNISSFFGMFFDALAIGIQALLIPLEAIVIFPLQQILGLFSGGSSVV